MDKKEEKLPEDSVVITGISGRFPQSDNMREFASNLYNKVNMVGDKENRIKHNFPGQPKHFGLVRNLEKFDAQAFFLPTFVARCIDPQGRILLEHAYEAIYDAGVSPKSLMGSNTGVFVGCFNYDSLEHWMFDRTVKVGMSSVGNAAYALANRLSFALGVNGPSFTVDTACSSSMYALNLAFNAIKNGECETALVSGTNLILSPFPTEDFSRAGVLAKNGISQPFDKDASGYVRAEACSVIFLQKARDAKRVYAEVVNCKTNNDGFKKEGPMVPSVELQTKLYESVYKNIDVDPSKISYVEAHATSTQVGDKKEVASIDEFFCKNRSKPLKVGSVKSNIGHAEGAAGMSSIAKSILIFENEKLIPNLNLKTLRDDCSALVEERIKVVTEVENFEGSYIGVNSFGVLGANAHVLLKKNLKEKINGGLPQDNLPRLVLWSGRSDEAINSVLDDILERPLDDEFIALLQNASLEANPASVVRGYGIFQKCENDEKVLCIERSTNSVRETKRPIAFVYSGVGSQWLGMGNNLMKIPIIADAIESCHDILLLKGLNLKGIITSTDPKTFNNVLHTFIGVAAIQIGLTNLLKAVNITPDFIIGHSAGELGCAFADETLTMEQTILAAYSRGVSINEVEREVCAMAAIGMGFKELRNIIPNGIEIACHNSLESCTVSGPCDSVKAFVLEAKAKNLLAKEIDSSGNAFHSSFIAESGPILLGKLKEIIKTPKKRSSKWISTSAPKDEWNKTEASLSSPEYHTNNLLKPVLFEEGLSMLPENVLIVEIAPHALLQPILKRSLVNGVVIGLTKKDADDGVVFLLQALGKLFEQGFDMDIRKIYPSISFPVSRGTSMISPLIRWIHTDNHCVPIYDPFTRCDKRNITIGLQDTKYEFMKGHQIDDRILLPATGYLSLVWETFAMMMGAEQSETSVCFEEVRFIRATLLSKDQETHLTIMIQRGSGHFEIIEGGITVVDGRIKSAENEKFVEIDSSPKIAKEFLNKDDFYKELSLRGYKYANEFRGVHEAHANESQGYGKIEWNSNWVSFTDCMLQIIIVANDSRDLFLPTSIRKIVIHPDVHEQVLLKNSEGNLLEIIIDSHMKVMQCGGVEISGLDASFVNRRRTPYEPLLEINLFVPHFPTPKLSKLNAAKFCVQLFLENAPSMRITLLEIDANDGKEPLSEYFNKVLEKVPLIVADISYLSEKEIKLTEITVKNESLQAVGKFDVVIKSNVANDQEFLKSIYEKTEGSGFILSRESEKLENLKLPDDFKCIASIIVENELILMIKCVKIKSKKESLVKLMEIPTNFADFTWISELKGSIVKESTIIYAKTDENFSGILGLMNCLKKEPNVQNLKCFLIDDSTAPDFNVDDPFYKEQVQLGLTLNVYRNSQWGTFRHLTFSKDSEPKPQKGHCFVNLLSRGDLTSLTWMEGPLKVNNDEVIDIHYSALNFRDILVATRRITLDYEMENRIKRQYICGYEFSGITKDGRRVMGLAKSKAFATHLSQKEVLLIEVPDKWTLEQAATIPLVYITVYTAFFLTTQIEKGKSILIHAGAGGVGLAAIRVALNYGLIVFTTVSTKEKTDFLLSEFPKLKAENIGNSRDTSFEQMVMKETSGKGVDYVLNSLADDKMQASIRCLADFGVFLEVGKFDMLMKNKIDLNHFLRGITFKAVLFRIVDLLQNENRAMGLLNIMQNDMNSEIIQPLKTTVFDASDIEQAFRFFASAKHIGKVLLKVRDNEKSLESLPISVQPRISLNSNFCYVVPGGLGGVGMEFVDWMIMRDCKKVVLSSSRGITSSYQSYRIKIWKSYGVEVQISTADITTKSGCVQLLQESTNLGEIGGIFNLAGVLRDAVFENQDELKFLECFKPKVFATKYLDELSRKLCPNLEYFVVFSSISCGRGNAGQSNYGMANSITERIVEKRHKNGLAGKAIQWGPIGEVGMLANMQKNKEVNGIFGMIPQRISSCLEALDSLISCSEPIVSSMIVAEKRKDLKNSKNLIETLMIAMGIPDIKAIKLDVPISELGMDSLGGAEIQQTLEREFGLVITFQELKSVTLNELQSRINGSKASEKIQNISSFMDSMWKNLHNGMIYDKIVEEFQFVENSKQAKMLIVPGMIGGVGQVWSKLQCSIYILQHIQFYAMTKFDDIYNSIESEVVKLFKDSERFVILGYSFGSMIALKLCEKLESLGKSGKLICVDGTPKFMKTNMLASMPENPSDEDIQNLIFAEFTVKTYGAIANEVLKSIRMQSTWQAKVEEFTKLIVDTKSKQFVTQNLEALFNRMKIILNEDKIKFSLSEKTSITLIKPSQSTLKIDADYGLKDYCQHEIRIETIDGDHYTIIENEEIVEIINNS